MTMTRHPHLTQFQKHRAIMAVMLNLMENDLDYHGPDGMLEYFPSLRGISRRDCDDFIARMRSLWALQAVGDV